MNLPDTMNSTLTRVQAFAVLSLSTMLLFGGLGVLLLWTLNKNVGTPTAQLPVTHGIETSWHSSTGSERVWSFTGPGDFHPWLDEHVAAVTEAQRLLPKEK
jgi:hypothetical protein